MKRIAAVAATFAAMVPASTAAAESSTCQAYNPQLCTPVAHTSDGGTLPFTGLDVALLAVGGGGLLGTGLVVRRLSSRQN